MQDEPVAMTALSSSPGLVAKANFRTAGAADDRARHFEDDAECMEDVLAYHLRDRIVRERSKARWRMFDANDRNVASIRRARSAITSFAQSGSKDR